MPLKEESPTNGANLTDVSYTENKDNKPSSKSRYLLTIQDDIVAFRIANSQAEHIENIPRFVTDKLYKCSNDDYTYLLYKTFYSHSTPGKKVAVDEWYSPIADTITSKDCDAIEIFGDKPDTEKLEYLMPAEEARITTIFKPFDKYPWQNGKQPIEPKGQEAYQHVGYYWLNNNRSTEIVLNTGKLTEKLKELGWRIFDGDYVLVSGGVVYKKDKTDLYELIVHTVSQKDVSFYAKDKLITYDRTSLMTRAQKELRGNINMLALSPLNEEFQRDTATEVYFHFKNFTLKVTKDKKEIVQRDNSKVIWEDQIIDHVLIPDATEFPEFSKYLNNVAGENLDSFITAIGSLLRNFTGSEGMRAIWCCDEGYEAGKANGRTGKSLIMKAIGKCRRLDTCNGKDFNPENQFKYQNITHSTQVFGIDDTTPKFDMKSQYNYVTEGPEIEKKHKAKYKIPLAETPRLIITSNYPPKIEEGASTTGRLHILPFKPHYMKHAAAGGVKAIHGHVFFDDWNQEEWSRFYWFMADCAMRYLQHGLITPDMAGIRKNRLKAIAAKHFQSNETAQAFCEWIYSYELPKSFKLEEVISSFEDHTDIKDMDKQVFSSCLKSFLDLEGIAFDKKRVNEKDESGKTIKPMKWIVL